MSTEKLCVVEGVLQAKQLLKFLESRNLPKKVWLSEDQTGISGRVQYDSKTNGIVGLVKPLDENAVPKNDAFLATSAKAIEGFFQNHKPASFLYVFMAQPLEENATPFCLNIFGSDNKMSHTDVTRIINYMVRKKIQD